MQRLIVDDSILHFFREINLGKAYVEKDDYYLNIGLPLLENIPLFEKHGLIRSRKEIKNLFFLYILSNGLVSEKWLVPDERMLKAFPNFFRILSSRGYNINKLPMFVIGKLVTKHSVSSKTNPNPEQEKLLTNKIYEQELKNEEKTVRATLEALTHLLP